jgi:hypothetical protein
MKTVYESETIKIVEAVDDDGDVQRQLFLGPPFRNVQGAIKTDRPKFHVQEFTRNLTYGALCVPGDVKTALFLGLGAGVVIQAVRDLFPSARVDIVDISAELIEVSHDFFFPIYSDNVSLFPEDALNFVTKANKKYDYICCDIWAHSLEIPGFLLDEAEGGFLDCVKNITNRNGVFSLNTQRYFHKQFAEALLRHFKFVYSLKGFNCLLLATHVHPKLITDEKIIEAMLSNNVDINAIQDNLLLIRGAQRDDFS